jgi:PKD repeat protein
MPENKDPNREPPQNPAPPASSEASSSSDSAAAKPANAAVPGQTPATPGQTPATPPEPAPAAPQDRVNPELAAVQMNQPRNAQTPSPAPAPDTTQKQGAVSAAPQAAKAGPGQTPKKIGKEQKKKEKARKNFLMGCAGTFVVFFILFVVLIVLMLSRSGASNPLLRAFNLDPAGIRNFLQAIVGFSFGAIAIAFFVIALVGLFRYLNTQKTDKDRKRRSIIMTLLSSFALVVVVAIWLGLANFIGRLEIVAEQVRAEVVVVEPDDLSNLEAPVEITFSAANVARALEQEGISIESMNWDLDGDGIFETPVTQPQITQLYNRQGVYNVGIQVKVAGEEDYRPPFTKVISIEDAVFSAEPDSGTAPLTVQFDASSLVNKSNVKSMDWDFDNDNIYDEQGEDKIRVRHTFDQIGTYNVHLRVVNKQNNVENYYRRIEVVPSDQPLLSPKIDASPGLEGSIPFQVRLDAGESRSLKGTIIKYQWDFGDGSDLQSGKSVSHVYQDPGFYTVTLTVEDTLGNSATVTAEVEAQGVSGAPEAVIETTPATDPETGQLTGPLPLKVTFDASDSRDPDQDIVDYMWDLNGDGETDEEGQKITYTYYDAGTYDVLLTVEDTEGQSGQVAMVVQVEEPGVQAVINATPEEGSVPLIVQFDGSSSSAFEGEIVSYEWDFGDGSPTSVVGASISHKYDTVGTYTARLKVTTNNDEIASAEKKIFVREVPLKACFTPSRESGTAPLTVSFDPSCSTGNVSNYHWKFGDGEESGSRRPTHTFEFPGEFTVSLEVSDDKKNVDLYQDVITVENLLR